MGQTSAARLRIIAAAVLFSTGGTAVKACALTGWQVACFRSGLAALALSLFLPAARRGWSWRSALVGTAYAATMILYVVANKLTTSANTIFLQDTAPLYVLLASPFLLRETVRRRDLLFMATVAAGLVLFFFGTEPYRETATDPMTGNVLAAIAGITWAATILGLRWLGRDPAAREGTVAAVAMGNVIAFLVCLPQALPVEHVAPADWAVVAYLGVFQIGLAYVLLTRGIAHVPAFEVSTLLLIEPVINPIWTYGFQGEVPSVWALCGGALILGATAVKTRVDAR